MPELYYHCSRNLYNRGDLILPGNWGRLILGTGPSHHRFFAEYMMERIRGAEFSDKPSRMEAAFAFEDASYATEFAGLKRGKAFEFVYAVRLVESQAPVHRGDMSWFDMFYQYRTFEGVEDVARRYWRGDERDPRQWELVIAGPLEVVDRLTRIGENGAPSPTAPESPEGP